MKYEIIQEYLSESFRVYDGNECIHYQERIYTYGELNKDSDRVAHTLQAAGIMKGDFVAVLLGNRYEMIASMIGIWKVGAVFVPFDQEYPLKRLQDMVESCGIQYVIRDENQICQHLLEECNDAKGILYGDMEPCSAEYLAVEYNPTDLAYLYFTSGTTGKPKPIMGVNKGLAHFIDWEMEEFGITETVRVSQVTPPCHDPFLRDVLLPLFTGGVLCIPDKRETILSAEKLAAWVNEEEIQLMHCTPSLFSILQAGDLEDSFVSLRYILLAGEKVVPNMLKKWYDAIGERVQLINMYGPTETTLAKLFYRIQPEDVKKNAIPIGMPIKGAQAIVLNDHMKLCAKGSVGEIYIRTPYRTKGYFGDETLTQKKFIQNPFSEKENDLIFKTGDQGRLLPDGNIVFEGRIDRQVKIRGFRVELSAIENTLLSIAGIKEAAVVYQNDESVCMLKAYVVTENGTVDVELLRMQMAVELPDYMVPNTIVCLDALPITGNNKLDYNALLSYKVATMQKEEELPITETEQRLYDIYLQILNKESISVEDSFFALGGSSLNSMALIGEVQRHFEVELPLGIIFENGSVRGIAEYIDSNKAPAADRIMHIEDQDAYLVTKAQRRMYVINQMIGENTIYNLPNIVRVTGSFDLETYQKAFQEMVDRHEILRTTFFVKDQDIFQEVHPTMETEVPCELLGNRNIDEVIEAFVQPFDLENGPLVRTKVIQESDQIFYLMFDMHHIVADGTSLGIFTREIMQLCAGKTLETMDIQYRDFAKWQMEHLANDNMKKMEEYWVDRFTGEIPVLDFPVDHPRPLIKQYDGAKVKASLDDVLYKKVQKLAKEISVSEFVIYYATYLILLHKYTGQDDLIVGTPVQGRNHYQLQDMIGMFVNTLPLRSKLDASENVRFFLLDLQDAMTEAFENSDYQLDDLIEKLDLVRDTSRNPLFDTVFSYHNYDVSGIQMNGIVFENYERKQVTSKFDMEFDVINRNHQVTMQIEYSTDLFKEATMEQLMHHYQLILSQIVEKQVSIRDVKLLMEEEIVFPGKPYKEISYPKECIHEIFEKIVKTYPERKALTMGDEDMTYQELNEKANQIARKLVACGIAANDYVPILAHRSFEMIIGVLAIIKAGAAYVPINPDYPKERIAYMLEQVQAKAIVIGDETMTERFESDDIPVLVLSDEKNYTGDGSDFEHHNVQSDLLYVIFTSGTTGKPKGVMIQHYNLVRLLFHEENLYDFNEHDVWMMFHEFCFDFSVWELFGALLYGGRLVLLSREIVRDTYAISEIVKKEGVTVFNQVPSAFYNYIKVDEQKDTALRYLIFGGEKLIPSKIRDWCKAHEQVRLINMYGITETTVHVTYKELFAEDMESNVSNIGKAIPTLKVYIMKGDELCGIGIPGEICVAGEGLAKGYINQEELTAEKFVENPMQPGEKIYRSGDAGRWLLNGDIEYLGRIDEQVQLRGFRIEMGEIESKLREFANIKDVVAHVKEHDTDSYLVAYYVAEEEIPSQTLREFLLEKLPEYMVPQFFVRMDSIQLTVNGKTDKSALPDPKCMEGETKEICLPETEMEKELADVWERVLGVQIENVNDNFFLLGGDSIKALQVVSELKKDNYTTKVDLIFHYQTIRELACHVEVLTQIADQGMVQGEISLFPIQEWHLHRENENKNHWNQAVLLQTEEEVDEDCLEGAFQRVVLHHDALRMVFDTEKGNAYIRGMEGELFEFIVEEEEGCCKEENVLQKANEIHKSFQIAEGPLMKAVLFKGEEESKLFICVHHLVIDSVSWRILIEDLLHSYRTILQDEEEELPLKTDSVKRWSEGLKQYFTRERIEDEVEYWMNLSQATHTKLVCKAGFEQDLYEDCEKVSKGLSAEETRQLLTEANVTYQTETQDLLLTALAKTIAEWNLVGSQFFVNLEGHGREDIVANVDITRTIGWFTSLYPVLLDSKFDDLGSMIKNTKEMVRRIPNRGIGYGILNEMADSPYKGKFTIKPEIGFSFFGEMNQMELDDSFHMIDMHYGNLIGKDVIRPYKLDITAYVEKGCLKFELEYNQKCFDKGSVKGLLNLLCENVLVLSKHCMEKDSIEYTPDDFGTSDISLDELAFILEAGDAIE